MATESGSCTRKWRWGWKRGTRQIKPTPVTKLKPEPQPAVTKKQGH